MPGVPVTLIKAVQRAPSMEAVDATNELPILTRHWLMELTTNPDLEEALYDPNRLIFRTTLDQLEVTSCWHDPCSGGAVPRDLKAKAVAISQGDHCPYAR